MKAALASGLQLPDKLAKAAARRLWRKTNQSPLSERGMQASQEKILSFVDMAPPLHRQSPSLARRSFRLLDFLLGPSSIPMKKVEDVILRDDDVMLILRTYSPKGLQGFGNPGLMYYHGGGGVIGDLNTHDSVCRFVADRTKAVVIALNYRLAPEHPFPVPVEDAIRGWNWLCGHTQVLGVDINRVGVGGDSAGGWLSVSVCQQAADPSLALEPVRMPAFQWLIYPMLDCRLETPSSKRCTSRMVLTRDTMHYFFDHLLPKPLDRSSVVVSPGIHPNLAGQPKAYVATAGFDPLEDEGRIYARSLSEQGVDVTYAHFPDVMHGFINFTGVCQRSQHYMNTMVDALIRLMKAH